MKITDMDRKALPARSEKCMQAMILAQQFNRSVTLLNKDCIIDPPIEPIPANTLSNLKKACDLLADAAYGEL